MNYTCIFKFTLSLCLLLLFSDLQAQKKGKKSQKAGVSSSVSTPKRTTNKSGLKPYSEVIGKNAKSDEGLFTVHFVGDKLYFEVPDSLIGVEMLLVSRIAQLPSGFGGGYVNAGGKANEQVVRWDRKGDKLMLRIISYQNIADKESPIYESVQVNNLEPIIQAFDIETINPDSSAVVIEVSSLYTKDVPALSGMSQRLRSQYKVRNLDNSRTFIDTAKSFPINVELKHTMTYNASSPPANSRSGSITLQMNQSMILLPKTPMKPRMNDDRVGWFSISQYNYSSEALKSDRKTYIRRWRLEPKDPEAYARGELVEPIKPIVYYLDPATPLKWRPYFKKGIEEWNKAFEAAGFKNAIIAKDPPSKEEDPDFSPEDARYSVVRYVASTTRNAVGPSVSDPRTGEILESDIIWYHNHLRSYRNRYLLETGAANPLARSLDTPEEAIGEMMRMVIAHEVGHALGLPHNMKASSAYPVDSLRSGTFTQKMGIAPSIMDYARYNYIAQPGDKNIRFVRQLGPYDIYAINWGYRVLPDAKTPEDELPTLRKWINEKIDDPIYQFGSGYGAPDPNAQTECIGDDAMKASTYGIKNLKIVANNLVKWTSSPGEDYTDLEELYGELLGVWRRYLGHVLTYVGGVHQDIKTTDQEGNIYKPVEKAEQKRAMEFLQREAFSTPEWLMNESILKKIEGSGIVNQIRSYQDRWLGALLSKSRMLRLIEANMFDASSYSVLEMMDDLRKGVFSELNTRKKIDVCRRNLQKAYLENMLSLLKETPATGRSASNDEDLIQSDIRSVAKAQLKSLQAVIRSISRTYPDPMSRYHLQDLEDRIQQGLNPN